MIVFVVFIALLIILAILLVFYHTKSYQQRLDVHQNAPATYPLASLSSIERRRIQAQQTSQLQGSQQVPTPASVIANLPVVKYGARGKTDPQEVCAICCCEFEEHDEAKLLPCMHLYHKDCIDLWLHKDHTCPLCKADVIAATGYTMAQLAVIVAADYAEPQQQQQQQRQHGSQGNQHLQQPQYGAVLHIPGGTVPSDSLQQHAPNTMAGAQAMHLSGTNASDINQQSQRDTVTHRPHTLCSSCGTPAAATAAAAVPNPHSQHGATAAGGGATSGAGVGDVCLEIRGS
eukprot:jgi/Chrzof1/15232/Cz09g32110.t1